MGLIYLVTNKINNKQYVGQTRLSLEKRKISHKSSMKFQKKMPISFAFEKYGWDNFEWEILEDNIDFQDLNTKEEYYIKKYNTYNNGYNARTSGHYSYMHEETKQKLSDLAKGRILSEETRKKISIAGKGRKHTEEAKRKIAEKTMGHKRNLGFKHSEKTLQKKAEAISEYWEITFPDNTVKVIKNLKKFCRENNLDDGKMTLVSQGKRIQHKNFKCRKIGKTC